jgi:tocopherol O-methyltransferase
MGMGEPLDNLDAVLDSLTILTADWGFGFSPKKVTVSTIGILDGLERLIDESECRLALSLHTPFPDAQFDFIWSMESGEHYPDKAQFFQESYRLLKPGGKLLMATWCHRPTHSLAGPLTESEQWHLEMLYKVYHLPYVLSVPDYANLAQQAGYTDIRTTDWSDAVAPFWDAVIRSVFQGRAIAGLLQSGWPTLQGAFALGLMRWGFQRGLIRYGILTATR